MFEPSDIDNDVTIEDLFNPSDDEPDFIIAEPAISDDEIFVPNINEVSIDTGPNQRKKFITARMRGALRAAEKVKEKYKKQRKKKIGQLDKKKKRCLPIYLNGKATSRLKIWTQYNIITLKTTKILKKQTLKLIL